MSHKDDPSLAVVHEEAQRGLDTQDKTSERIDTKAAATLAFTGLLITLTRHDERLFVSAGRITAVAAAVIALGAFFPWPRRRMLELKRLRRYLAKEAAETTRYLVLLKTGYEDRIASEISQRRLALRMALILVVVSMTLIALGATLSDTREVVR
ncbi:hypothetical protein SMC26_45630 [Actinomadura fulvescens]